MRKLLLGLIVLALGCTAPNPNGPDNGKGNSQSQIVQVNIGASPNPTCTAPDGVFENVPTVITHGTPAPISMSATLGGNSVSNPCGQVAWIVTSPGTVANAGSTSTSENATAAGSFTVQGCFGSVCGSIIPVTAN